MFILLIFNRFLQNYEEVSLDASSFKYLCNISKTQKSDSKEYQSDWQDKLGWFSWCFVALGFLTMNSEKFLHKFECQM